MYVYIYIGKRPKEKFIVVLNCLVFSPTPNLFFFHSNQNAKMVSKIFLYYTEL